MTRKTKGLEIDYCVTDENIFEITPIGRIDTLSSEIVLEAFEDEWKNNDIIRSITVDASDLTYISSAGLRVFLIMGKKTSSRVKIHSASETIKEIVEVTGFDDLFDLEL